MQSNLGAPYIVKHGDIGKWTYRARETAGGWSFWSADGVAILSLGGSQSATQPTLAALIEAAERFGYLVNPGKKED